MTFCIGRREVITLIGGAAAAPTLLWPLAARAQKGDRKPRIGVLMNLAESDPEARPRLDAFERRLQELGWTKDRNVLIDYGWTAGDYDRMRSYAAELVGLGSNAILAAGAPVTEILQKTTGTVPIVFRIGLRSDRQRLHSELGTPRRQHDRRYLRRVHARRKVARDAERDRPVRHAGRSYPQLGESIGRRFLARDRSGGPIVGSAVDADQRAQCRGHSTFD